MMKTMNLFQALSLWGVVLLAVGCSTTSIAPIARTAPSPGSYPLVGTD